MEIVVTPQAEGLQLVECFRWNIIYTGTVTHSSKTTERNIRLDLLRDMFCTLCFLCQWSWDPAVEVSYILEPETELLHLLWSYSHSHPELWRTHTCTQAHRLTLRSAHAWVQFTAEYSQKEQFASWVCVCVYVLCTWYKACIYWCCAVSGQWPQDRSCRSDSEVQHSSSAKCPLWHLWPVTV